MKVGGNVVLQDLILILSERLEVFWNEAPKRVTVPYKKLDGLFRHPEYCLLDMRQEIGRHQLPTLKTTRVR